MNWPKTMFYLTIRLVHMFLAPAMCYLRIITLSNGFCREMHYLSNLFILHVCNFCIWTIILLEGILLKIMISSFELLFFMRHWLLIERCTQQFPGHVQNGVVYLHISISVYFPWNSTTFNFVSFLHKSAFLHRSIISK